MFHVSRLINSCTKMHNYVHDAIDHCGCADDPPKLVGGGANGGDDGGYEYVPAASMEGDGDDDDDDDDGDYDYAPAA
ncbi:hypothetical protein CsSME_00023067 [Camellia sinensis var. sinensis]